ncbi:uncharacterized protein [Panulirus ornatus]|uniref:uncharacterized protein n=1 Tax=Panulirus ornatus TaxID=150431 RepID=UPI003A8B767C
MQTKAENHSVEHQDCPAIEVVLHAPPFFQRFQEFRRKELFTDLCIHCGSECHYVHSSVLAAACPPICLLLEESRRHNEDKCYSRVSPKPPYSAVINEELEVNRVFSEAYTGFGKSRKANPFLSKQFDEVKVLGDVGDHSTQHKECLVLAVPIKDAVDSHITLSLSNNVTGVWNLSVQGIEPQVMNYIIQFVYWEKFIAAEACIHNFISTARSLQLLGCESVCKELQFVTLGERRYFEVPDENKTLDSSCRIEASYTTVASNKAGSSCQPFAHDITDDVEVRLINPVQKLGRESKVESSNITRWKDAQGQNDSVLRQEKENKERNCAILREDGATRVKNFVFRMPSVKETKGRSVSLWRPYEIKLETVIFKLKEVIKAKIVKVSGRERDTKARHDCVPRQEGEIKTRNDTVLTHQGENEVVSGPFLRQMGKNKDGNDFVPKQEYTRPDLSEWEENTFSRWEVNRVENYSLPKHEKSKDFTLSSKHRVLDYMNFPQRSRNTSKEQKCLISPRGIYFNHSCYSHELQNLHCTLEVGCTTGGHKICDRENCTLREDILRDVTFSPSQILDSMRKGTHQNSNLILAKDMFNRNIAEILSRSCNKDRVEFLMCTIQKMQGRKGLHDMEDCNDTERKDNSTLVRFDKSTVKTEESVGESCIIDALRELHDLMEDQSLLMPIDSNIRNAKAPGKSKFSRCVASFKRNRPVGKFFVYNEHSYCKMQSAVAVKRSLRKVSHSSNYHKISYISSDIGTHRVNIGSDVRTANDRFLSRESKNHSTFDLQYQILECEGNQEFNKGGFHNTHLQMITNTKVKSTYEIEQGQDKEKFTVEEDKPERGSRYQKPNCNLHWIGKKNSELNCVSHNRSTDYRMCYKRNSSTCADQGLNIPDHYCHKFEPANQEPLLCKDLCIMKLEEQTNCVIDIPKQAKCHSFDDSDVQRKVWTDKVVVDGDRKLQTEVNNHSKGDKDYKVESWNTLMKNEDEDILESDESSYKIRNDRKNKKVKVRHNMCVDRERERNLESKEETLKGILKNMLQNEKNNDPMGYQQRGTVTEVKLSWFEDEKGKPAHGDFLNCRFGDGKRWMQEGIQDDKYEDGKEIMPVRKYGSKCSPSENYDKKMRPTEGLDMKDTLIEDISLKDQPYDDDEIKLKECNIKFPIVENKSKKDQFIDNDSFKTLQVKNVLQDASGKKNCLKDLTLKQVLRKNLECEFDFDKNKDGRVEGVHDGFKKDNLIDTRTERINFRRGEKQSKIEANELNKHKVDEVEFEKKKIICKSSFMYLLFIWHFFQNGFPQNNVQEHHSRTPYHLRRTLGGGFSGFKTSSYVFEEFREEISTSETVVAEGSSNGINDFSTGHHKQYENKMSKKMKVGNVISSKIDHPVGKMQLLRCCSMSFPTVKALMQHIIWYHKQDQECVPCLDPACPVKLWTSNMNSHLRCHTVQGEFKCHLCTYSGRNAVALRVHKSAHRKKAVQEIDGPSGQRQTVKYMRPENPSLQSSGSCTVSHEIVPKNYKTLKPLCSHAEHSKRLNLSSCHEIDKTSQSSYQPKGVGKGKNSSVYQVEKFDSTKISVSSDHSNENELENESTCEDFVIEKARKAVSRSSESIRKVKFFSLRQRGKKEKLSCLNAKVEKKKNLKAIQKWKLSQRDIMLMNDSQENASKSIEKKDIMNNKILTKRKINGFNGKSKLVKECLFDRGELVKETYKNTNNIKKWASCIPIKSNYNEVQKKAENCTLSEITVNEEKDETSSVEVLSTVENALNLFNESLNVGLKRHIEEKYELDSGKSQSHMKVQANGTQSSNYTCPLCVDYFDTPDRLLCHYVYQHAYHSPYICKFEGCPVLLKKRDSWKHLIGHLYRKSFRCHLCSYSHQSLPMLRHHLFCHSQVIQELELRDEFHIQIQGPSGDTEVLLTAESVRKKYKRKFSTTKDNRIASKRRKEDICRSTEPTSKLEGQNMLHLSFETCMP